MPDDFDEIERQYGAKAAAPAVEDFDAIEAQFGAKAEAPRPSVAPVRAAIYGSEDPRPVTPEQAASIFEMSGARADAEARAKKYEAGRAEYADLMSDRPATVTYDSPQAEAFDKMGGREGYLARERDDAMLRYGVRTSGDADKLIANLRTAQAQDANRKDAAKMGGLASAAGAAWRNVTDFFGGVGEAVGRATDLVDPTIREQFGRDWARVAPSDAEREVVNANPSVAGEVVGTTATMLAMGPLFRAFAGGASGLMARVLPAAAAETAAQATTMGLFNAAMSDPNEDEVEAFTRGAVMGGVGTGTGLALRAALRSANPAVRALIAESVGNAMQAKAVNPDVDWTVDAAVGAILGAMSIPGDPEVRLRSALDIATKRGIPMHLALQDIYDIPASVAPGKEGVVAPPVASDVGLPTTPELMDPTATMRKPTVPVDTSGAIPGVDPPRLVVPDVVTTTKSGPPAPKVVEAATRQAEVAGRTAASLRRFEERTGMSTEPEPVAPPPPAPEAPKAETPVTPTPEPVAPTEPPAPEGPTPKDRAERGAVDVGAVTEPISEGATKVKSVFASLVERVRSRGTPAAREAAALAERAVDAKKKIVGAVSSELNAALKDSGASPASPLGKAVVSLSRPMPDGSSRLYEAIEGRVTDLSPAEARIVEKMRALIDKLGAETEARGVKQLDPRTGEWSDFERIPGGKVAPRIMSAEFSDIMQRGPSAKGWKQLVNRFAELNGMDPAKVDEIFTARHEDMVGEGPEGVNRRAQAEYKRQWKRVPMTVKVDGVEIPLFETNPYTYAKRLAEARASRLGVVDAFGQDVPGQEPTDGRPGVGRLRARFAKETGKPEDFVMLMRALHGAPIDKPMIDPASSGGRLARVGGTAAGVVKEALLSGAAVQNIPEPIGNVLSFLGFKRFGKALVESFKGKKGAYYKDAVEKGAATPDIPNRSWDPARPFDSGVRMLRDVLGRLALHRRVNEFQERMSAVGARMFADDMRAGKGTDTDVQRLMGLGYDRAAAEHLVSGKATDAEYDALVRKVPGQTVGANLGKAEQSKFQQSRVMRPFNWFAGYAHMKMRGVGNQAIAAIEGIKRASEPGLSAAERWSRGFAAAKHLTGWVGGQVAQGVAQYFLWSGATGGSAGLKTAVSEAKDDPVEFALSSFAHSVIGGPFAAAARTMTGKGDLSSLSTPFYVTKQIVEAIGGNGQFRDMDFADRMKELGKRMVPASRVIAAGAVAVGLGSEEAQQIDVARRAYWRWRNEDTKTGTFTPGESTEEQIRYRTAMKAAYRAVTNGSPPDKVNALISRALGVNPDENRSKLAASIRAKRLLSAPDVKGKLDALKSRVGDDSYRALEAHDALLDRLADAVQNDDEWTGAK